jgi:death-on-curing protein
MRYLTLPEVLDLHDRIIGTSKGARGIRDLGALGAAVNRPRQAFDGRDLYPDLYAKAAALCHSLVMNHPFLDGNKRVGHAAMETFLILNGHVISAPIETQERALLDLAAGKLTCEELTDWLREHSRGA